jgi:hypothetical protein
MTRSILAIAMYVAASAALLACSGVKAADKENFCRQLTGKTSGKKCDCTVGAVEKNYGGKASDFIRYSLGELKGEEKAKVEKSLDDVKVSTAKKFAEDMAACEAGG